MLFKEIAAVIKQSAVNVYRQGNKLIILGIGQGHDIAYKFIRVKPVPYNQIIQ